MKYSLAITSLTGLAIATDPCQDNCGRAVAGAGRPSPALAVRSSLCSAFVTATSTFTPPATTVTAPIIYNRNVHEARASAASAAQVSAASAARVSAASAARVSAASAAQVSAASAAHAARAVVGEKPAYASACANAEAYWTACQCFPGVTATTLIVNAPTPTVTVPGPVCTQGVEYAIYAVPTDSPRWQNLVEAISLGHPHVDFALQFSGVEPDVTGVTPHIGNIVQWDDDWLAPVRIYGTTGPAGSQMSSSLIDHRTWLLPPLAGTYTIILDTSDNALYAWVGDVAVSGWSPINSAVSRFWPPDASNSYTYDFEVQESEVGRPLPFRLLWLNYGGPGALSARIIDPQGNVILGPDTQKSPSILASCAGDGTPVSSWVPWSEEI